jgi:hypothetical protein
VDLSFLIVPQNHLVLHVKAVLDADFASVILERIVVSHSHVSKSDDSFELSKIKIGFLVQLLYNRIWDYPTQFEDVFGSVILSTTLFDQWWSISEIETVSLTEWTTFLEQHEAKL